MNCLADLYARLDTRQAKNRPLIAVAGFIHDVGSFLDDHPGGRHLLVKKIGTDATTAFFGGVYNHSNAAHNVSISVSIKFDFLLIVTLIEAFGHEASGHITWRTAARHRRDCCSAFAETESAQVRRDELAVQLDRDVGRRGYARGVLSS